MSNCIISGSWYLATINNHARTNKSIVINLVLDFYSPGRGIAEARVVPNSSGKNNKIYCFGFGTTLASAIPRPGE